MEIVVLKLRHDTPYNTTLALEDFDVHIIIGSLWYLPAELKPEVSIGLLTHGEVAREGCQTELIAIIIPSCKLLTAYF